MKGLILLLILPLGIFAQSKKDTVRRDTSRAKKFEVHGLYKMKVEQGNYNQGTLDAKHFNESIKVAARSRDLEHKNQNNFEMAFADVLSVSESEAETNPKKKPAIQGPTPYDSRIETLRLDPNDTSQRRILENCDAVAMVIERKQIHRVSDSVYQLDISATLGQRFNLCKGEPFAGEPVVGLATCFAVSSKDMVTAGHVFTAPLSDYLIVFNFKMLDKAGAYNPLVLARNIYSPQRVKFSDPRLDVVIFTVDRTLLCTPLSCSNSNNKLKVNTPVYMIGYPSGLPQKVALNAEISENKDPAFIYTSLDAFQGNSGSPVFNLNTHQVIGLLVAGEYDLRASGSCNVSTICRIPYCKGEKVVKITNLADYLSF